MPRRLTEAQKDADELLTLAADLVPHDPTEAERVARVAERILRASRKLPPEPQVRPTRMAALERRLHRLERAYADPMAALAPPGVTAENVPSPLVGEGGLRSRSDEGCRRDVDRSSAKLPA